jgi:hypothetical protein
LASFISNRLTKVYNHFDWVAFGLLAIIILLPKMPLISINGTYVNVRIEDFLVVIIYGLWVIGWIAGRYSLPKVFNRKAVIGFLIYGFIITALGILVFQTVKSPHLGALHWIRRVEYMGMYFIVATVAKKENLAKYIYSILGMGVLTWIYGFLQWQDIVVAFHTLNKSGVAGTYTEIGYVISSFGAHYDFGAFLILMMMFSVWGYYTHTKWWKRILFVLLALAFWWMSRLAYARAAYLGMFVGLVVVFAIRFSGWILLPLYEILQTFDRYFGGRFSRYKYDLKFDIVPAIPTSPPEPVVLPTSTLVGDYLPVPSAVYPSLSGTPAPLYNVTPPPPTPTPTPYWLTRWLDTNVNTLSEKIKGSFGMLDINLDPSANVRLIEWQDGIARVGYHFLWGGGYYTYGLGADNDYLRHMIEVGVIGLSVFLLIIWDFVRLSWRSYHQTIAPSHKYFHLAIIGFITGLLIEAIFIDIFEASKIAFLFWYLMGLVSLFSLDYEKSSAGQA